MALPSSSNSDITEAVGNSSSTPKTMPTSTTSSHGVITTSGSDNLVPSNCTVLESSMPEPNSSGVALFNSHASFPPTNVRGFRIAATGTSEFSTFGANEQAITEALDSSPSPFNGEDPAARILSLHSGSTGSSQAQNAMIYQPGNLDSLLRGPSFSESPEYHMSDRHVPQAQASLSQQRPQRTRRKSSEPVRSSLKTSRDPSGSTKGVQFDRCLEQVRCFSPKDQPSALSRSNSGDDETDVDFPSHICGDPSPEEACLTMRLVNQPRRTDRPRDVVLERMELSSDTTGIWGTIKVLNIAFEKTVAVRFTLDCWQTSNEVFAKYEASPSSQFDRFCFFIDLSHLAIITSKNLELAVRYCAAGREMWDNNGNRNYIARIMKSVPLAPLDLHSTTEMPTTPALARLHRQVEGIASDPPLSSPLTSLKSRYDLNASLKKSPSRKGNGREDTSVSYPMSQSRPGSSIPFPTSLPAPSPSTSPRPRADLTPDSSPEPPSTTSPSQVKRRRHQRGYTQTASPMDTPSLKRTPPGSPTAPNVHLQAFPFMPSDAPLSAPIDPPCHVGLPAAQRLSRTDSESSESSTGSIATPSTSPIFGSPTQASQDMDYKQFITKFCFFTGSFPFEEKGLAQQYSRRISTSSVEYLPSAFAKSNNAFRTPAPMHHRSSSLDSITPPSLSPSYRHELSSPGTPRMVIGNPSLGSPVPRSSLLLTAW